MPLMLLACTRLLPAPALGNLPARTARKRPGRPRRAGGGDPARYRDVLSNGCEQRDRGGAAPEGDRGDMPQEQGLLPHRRRADAGEGIGLRALLVRSSLCKPQNEVRGGQAWTAVSSRSGDEFRRWRMPGQVVLVWAFYSTLSSTHLLRRDGGVSAGPSIGAPDEPLGSTCVAPTRQTNYTRHQASALTIDSLLLRTVSDAIKRGRPQDRLGEPLESQGNGEWY